MESGCTKITSKQTSYDCRAKIKFDDETIKKSLNFSVLKGDEIEYIKIDTQEIPFLPNRKEQYFYRIKQ